MASVQEVKDIYSHLKILVDLLGLKERGMRHFWMSHPATGWLVILVTVFFPYHPMCDELVWS
jgi:hypothetical protein